MTKLKRICKHCEEEFKSIEGRVFSNHVRWCDKNQTNGDKGIKKATESQLKSFEKKNGKLKKIDVICLKCKKEFKVEERAKRHPEKKKYYCSRGCANSRVHSEETKRKQSEGNKGNISPFKKEIPFKKCAFCEEEFQSKNKKYCSKKCKSEALKKCKSGALRIDKTPWQNYSRDCSFKFSLNDYPDKFNFSLIEKYGWYKAKNHGDNPNGVSRDHIISKRFGFDNNISSEIISHPANCQLLRHNDNVSKGIKCGLTIEELKEKIINF